MSWKMCLLCFLYKLCVVLLYWMLDVGLLCSNYETKFLFHYFPFAKKTWKNLKFYNWYQNISWRSLHSHFLPFDTKYFHFSVFFSGKLRSLQTNGFTCWDCIFAKDKSPVLRYMFLHIQ
jgi:hypothetical protein